MIVLIIVGVLLILLCYYLFPIIQVCGCSMYPTYRDGEIIFGTRLYRDELKVGDVILYKSPTDEKRIVVKRIHSILDDGRDLYFYCLGDNADCSYDSRHYGYVSSKRIVCKVINQRGNVRDERDNNLCN